jgi:uncharacterized protein (DUF2384 family)
MKPSAKKAPKLARRRSRLSPWAPQPRVHLAVLPGCADELRVDPKLERVIKALGVSAAAEILDIDKAQLSRCARGTEPIGTELARRISDVEYVLERAARVMHEDEIGPWLISPEPLLGDATPLNTLALRGAGPVINALEGIFAGALV